MSSVVLLKSFSTSMRATVPSIEIFVVQMSRSFLTEGIAHINLCHEAVRSSADWRRTAFALLTNMSVNSRIWEGPKAGFCNDREPSRSHYQL